MGQQSMIIVVLSSLLLSISVFGIMGGWNFSDETTATLFEREQALNITRSGVNLAVSKLRKQKVWRTGFNGLSVAGGQASVSIQDLGMDTVKIISVGTVNGFSHQSEVVAKLSSIFPNVESALTVFGDSVEFHNDGKSFEIDGRDYLEDGKTLGTAPPVSGMGVQSDKIVNDIKSNLNPKVHKNFNGLGGIPSVGSFKHSDLAALQAFYKNLATITLPAGKYSYNGVFGTMANPEIVHVPGDLEWNGTISGAGILVVDGKLQMSGNISWKGIILTMSGDVTIELGGSGNPHVLGTVWVGNSNPANVTDVHINGNPAIKYSHTVLSTILANLGLLDVEIISYYE